jgi:hypothetical protein
MNTEQCGTKLSTCQVSHQPAMSLGGEMGTQAQEIAVYFPLGVAGTKMAMSERTDIPGRLVFNGPSITESCCLLWFAASLVP